VVVYFSVKFLDLDGFFLYFTGITDHYGGNSAGMRRLA